MIEWLAATRWRMPVVLIVYFSLHIAARSLVSPSLDYDESEQAFLSQCLSFGYNSQPPLYTWVQTGLFEVLGYSVFSLAVLKNALLCGTFLLVFELVRKVTGDVKLGAIAAIGLLTIPQIAWESHRDLSHTVAVTFATTLVFYSVVSLAHDGRTRWYLLIGMATALGILSKYNFAIVILAVVAASLTLPSYRKRLLDWRLAISLAVSAVLILPHAIWMSAHIELTSSKTMATMTTNQTGDWLHNVATGMTALWVSTLACCSLTLVVFLPCVYRHVRGRRPQRLNDSCEAGGAATLLLERFLVAVTILLCALVLSGNALEFKNRWLQPLIVMLPAYLVLRLRCYFPTDRQAMNRVAAIGCAAVVLILAAVVLRPLIGSYRTRYCWLNVPYPQLASSVGDRINHGPAVIVAPNMRIAGNLRLQFPDSDVISADHQYLSHRILAETGHDRQVRKVIVVTDQSNPHAQHTLFQFAAQALSDPAVGSAEWQRLDFDYLYGTGDAHQPFYVCELATEGATR